MILYTHNHSKSDLHVCLIPECDKEIGKGNIYGLQFI